MNNSLKQHKQELEKLSAFKTGLYMDWKNGDISREEYQEMKKSFDEKERKLKQDIISLQEENQKAAAQVTPQNPYFDAFRKYGNITVIDRGIVTELINTIHIHEGGDITIDWNFADQHKRILEQLECCGNELSARYH